MADLYILKFIVAIGCKALNIFITYLILEVEYSEDKQLSVIYYSARLV